MQVVVLNRPGSVTRVLWARGGNAVTVRLSQTPGTQSAQLFNALGEEQALPAGSAFPIRLPSQAVAAATAAHSALPHNKSTSVKSSGQSRMIARLVRS